MHNIPRWLIQISLGFHNLYVTEQSLLTEFRFIVVTCGTGPYSLAFPEAQTVAGTYFDYIFNFFFFLDIIQNFVSAYQSPNLTIVDDTKVILIIWYNFNHRK